MRYNEFEFYPANAFSPDATGRIKLYGKGDAPPAPDYAGAAQATAAGNAEAARIAAKANRVSQYTPYGNLIYSQGGNWDQAAYNAALAKDPNVSKTKFGYDPDVWTATTELSPAQQQLLDRQNQVSLGLADLSGTGLDYVKNMLSKPFDTSKLPAEMVNAGQTAQDAIMARLNPQLEQSENALRQRLANQGITPGSEAWNNEFRSFNAGRNDAYSQAALQGIGVGQQARQQALQEQAYLRNEPLNTLNAVRTGAQVTNPSFTSVPQQATTQGPDLLGAANSQYNAAMSGYNADQASSNGLMSGLFTLGGAMLGSPWLGAALGAGAKAASDPSVKENIQLIGSRPDGLNVYSFEYKPEYRDEWGHGIKIGVMANEVETIYPHAISIHEDGYKVVDYGALNA